MAELFLHGRRTESIFELLGDHENDITYSVGWALARSPSFLHIVLTELIGWEGSPDHLEVRLQQSELNRNCGATSGSETFEANGSNPSRKSGITDIEIIHPSDFYVIIEAKRGWCLPGILQLEKYALRESFVKSRAAQKLIVVASECTNEYALSKLPFTSVHGIHVMPVSWKSLHDHALRASRSGKNAEKRLLNDLIYYLRGLMTMQQLDSNWVYVLSLRDATEPGWRISWTDIVNVRHRYFHPVGPASHWPATPPNYIAFRYGGRLRSIHHIEDYEIVTDLHSRFKEIPSKEGIPYFIYTLGPAFAPTAEVQTGNIWPSGRVWCMLDTLFTASSIAQARDASKVREASLGRQVRSRRK